MLSGDSHPPDIQVMNCNLNTRKETEEEEDENAILDKEEYELGNKYLGHRRSFVRRKRKMPCSWFCDLYHHVFYASRPDTVNFETGKQQWNQIHDSRRYLSSLFFYVGPPTYLLWNLLMPLSIILAIILANATYYTCATYNKSLPTFDRSGNAQMAFSYSSFALSLLLALRLQRTYERWWAACLEFGRVTSKIQQLAHLAVLQKNIAPELRDEFLEYLCVYPYAVLVKLQSFKTRMPREALGLANSTSHRTTVMKPEDIQFLLTASDPRVYVALKLRKLMDDMECPFEKYWAFEGLMQTVEAAAMVCLRIKRTNIPVGISFLTTGFVMFWLVLLPFAVFPAVQSSTEPRVVTIWFSALVLFFFSLLLLSIDEISNQLEDPWYSLPLISIARSSRQAVESAVSMSRLLVPDRSPN
eukprot:jgi/Picsp_1/5420/NSC_02779-R1_protein